MPIPLQYSQQLSRIDRIMGPQTAQVRWTTAGALILAFFVVAAILTVIVTIITGSPFHAVALTGIVLAVAMQSVRQARQRWSARVLNHLETAVRTHVDLAEYLMAAAEAESRPVRSRLRSISTSLADGIALPVAVAIAVPELRVEDLRLLGIGEATGELEIMLARIMQRRKTRASLFAPSRALVRLYIPFVIGSALLSTFFIGTFVIPKFQVIMRDFRVKPTGLAAFALSIPQLLTRNLGALLVGAALFAFALYWLLRDVVQIFLPRRRRTLPLVYGGRLAGFLLRDRMQADICWSLSASVRMGLPLATALEDLERSGLPKPIAKRIRIWHEGLLAGKSDVAAASDAGMPPLLCSVLRTGGEQLPESLSLLGDFFDTRHARRDALLRGMILPVVTLIMAGFTLLIALSVFLPILMMIEQLNHTWSK